MEAFTIASRFPGSAEAATTTVVARIWADLASLAASSADGGDGAADASTLIAVDRHGLRALGLFADAWVSVALAPNPDPNPNANPNAGPAAPTALARMSESAMETAKAAGASITRAFGDSLGLGRFDAEENRRKKRKLHAEILAKLESRRSKRERDD
uniref:Uncharacterized protein n=1 Tax=Phaeomonas parva TaxID=124430 RepID=A0A7S1XPE9_9STRA|mmetsp:Transcript_21770/g.66653  ORF Transcript_21770/g.66653 Transcript_21770/m.66653 type:complete len:157 (+) Transcript_21770:176-646(+)